MPCLHGLHGPTIIPNGQYWLVKNGIPQLILKMGIMMVNYPIDWGLWWIMMDYDSDYDGSYYWIIIIHHYPQYIG